MSLWTPLIQMFRSSPPPRQSVGRTTVSTQTCGQRGWHARGVWAGHPRCRCAQSAKDTKPEEFLERLKEFGSLMFPETMPKGVCQFGSQTVGFPSPVQKSCSSVRKLPTPSLACWDTPALPAPLLCANAVTQTFN